MAAVRDLDLPAVADGLIEDAELVADAEAHRGDLQGGQGIEIAGGEAAQTAVAETRFFLFIEDGVQVEFQVGHGGAGLLFEAEA